MRTHQSIEKGELYGNLFLLLLQITSELLGCLLRLRELLLERVQLLGAHTL